MKKLGRENQYWWEAPIEELSLPQLQQLKSALEELKTNVAKQAEKLIIQNTNQQQFFIGSSSAGVNPNYQTNNISFDANMMPQGGYNPNPEGSYNPNSQGYIPGPPGLFGRDFF